MKRIDIDALLELPADLRADVAHRLLESLNPADPEIDALWAAEAERRVGLRRAGKSKTVAGSQVLRQARKRAEHRGVLQQAKRGGAAAVPSRGKAVARTVAATTANWRGSVDVQTRLLVRAGAASAPLAGLWERQPAR